MRTNREALLDFFDDVLGEKYRPGRFHINQPRRPRKRIPEWALSDKTLKAKVLGQTARRYRIAYLYWRAHWNAREVGEELQMSQSAVESVLRQLRKG